MTPFIAEAKMCYTGLLALYDAEDYGCIIPFIKICWLEKGLTRATLQNNIQLIQKIRTRFSFTFIEICLTKTLGFLKYLIRVCIK